MRSTTIEERQIVTTSDADLVARHLAGDRSAFDEIVRRNERQVYAVALRVCGNTEDARDVAQEVFVSALTGLRSFRSEAKLSTWFYRVAMNAALDTVRRRQRREARPLEDAPERPSRDPGPEDYAVAHDRAAAVHEALAGLSPDYRAAVVLYDLEGLDYAEIAEVLGVPLGTVKSRIHRARVELAKRLGHLRPELAERSQPLT